MIFEIHLIRLQTHLVEPLGIWGIWRPNDECLEFTSVVFLVRDVDGLSFGQLVVYKWS